MKRFFTLLLLCFFAFAIQAQDGNFDNLDYSRGTIVLSNGTILPGLLNYNTRDGILFYKNENETKIYTPRNIRYFSFHDAKQSGVRKFYSLEYEDEEYGTKRFYFFELLEEFSNFAILSKVDQLEIKSNSYYTTLATTIGFPTGSFNSPYKPIQYKKQDETVYLVDQNGIIQPYLETRYVYKGYGMYIRTKIFEKELLGKYFGGLYNKLQQYSRENHLSFENKEDFLKIIAYYKNISE